MAVMNKSTKTVWYKRSRHNIKNKTLQQMLGEALDTLKGPIQRLWAPAGDDGAKLGINRFSPYKGALGGQFVLFEPGQKQPVITVKDGVPEFDISAMAAGDGGKEFLEGICYFLVFKDHILFVKPRALGTKEFERYLSWLLCSATSAAPADAVIVVDDQVATTTQQKVARKKVRGVTFGTPLKPVATPATSGGKAVVVYQASGSTWDALRAIFGVDIFQNVKMTQALDEAQLHVQVTVRVKGKQHVSDDAHKTLQAVASAARHLDPEDVELEVQGVGTIKGKDLKIHKNFSVELLESGGLVDESALWQKMLDWLKQLIEDGTLTA